MADNEKARPVVIGGQERGSRIKSAVPLNVVDYTKVLPSPRISQCAVSNGGCRMEEQDESDEVHHRNELPIQRRPDAEGETDPIKDSIILVSSIPSNTPQNLVPGFQFVILLASSLVAVGIIIEKNFKS